MDHVGMNIDRETESRFRLFKKNAKSDFIGIFGAHTKKIRKIKNIVNVVFSLSCAW
jgi:hypothetical protein